MSSKSSFGRSGDRFLRFWEVFENIVFGMIWGSAKSLSQIWKMRFVAGKGNLLGKFWEGRRDARCKKLT